MNLREFRDTGCLDDIDRRVLHPHGMTLALTEDDDGDVRFSALDDLREDPRTFAAAPERLAVRVDAMVGVPRTSRLPALGFWVESLESLEPADDR